MKDKELNRIIFKFVENYNNEGEKELIASVGVRGNFNVSIINLSNKNNAEESQPLELEGKITPSRYTINDKTENLFSVEFITDSEGYGVVELTRLLSNPTFLKFYQKYKGEVTLSITIEIPKTEKYKVFVENFKITPTWDMGEEGLRFEPYDYYRNDGEITLSPIEDRVTDFATLRQKYKTIEDSYLLVKKQYESQIVGEIDIEIDTVEDYEPKKFKNVITRLLEFQVGTLQPAIEYTKTAKLTKEYERLNTISKLVDILSKMYPNIKIDDGEGIPYSSEKK